MTVMTVWLVLVSWGIEMACPPFEPGTKQVCEVLTTRTKIAQVVDMPTCLRVVLLLETNREYPHPDDHYTCEHEEAVK